MIVFIVVGGIILLPVILTLIAYHLDGDINFDFCGNWKFWKPFEWEKGLPEMRAKVCELDNKLRESKK